MGLDALPHGQAATVAGDGDHVVPAELVRVAMAAVAGFFALPQGVKHAKK
jgi:hypothetical protein